MKKLLRSIRGSSQGSGRGDDKDKKDKSKQDKNLKHQGVDKDGPNLLCFAAYEGDIDRASEAIKVFGVNSLDAQLQRSPLHYAARGGHLQMIKFLIDEGADPTIQCSEGRTPLFSAIEGNHEECANFLIQKGYFTDKQDKNGSTVLHFAAFYGVPQCFRKIYTLRPELMGVYDKAGHFPIHVAVKANREDIVNYICSVHIESCEARTKVEKQTPLMLAVEGESVPLVMILLEARCRTDAKDKYGTTVELLAKSRANDEICSLIEQWSPQNNYESDKIFQTKNANEDVNEPKKQTTTVFDSKESNLPQFNATSSALPPKTKSFTLDDNKIKRENLSTDDKLLATAVIHKESKIQSDEDSEWESSEAEFVSKKDSPKLNPELTKRISQAFFTPVDGNVNLFQTPNKFAYKTPSVFTAVFNVEKNEIRDEKNVSSTMTSESQNGGKVSTMIAIEEENENTSVPETHSKSNDRTLDSFKDSRDAKVETPTRESTSKLFQSEIELPDQDKKLSYSTDKLNFKSSPDNVKSVEESDVSDWSKETENPDKSIKSADLDNILSLIDKENLPVFKDKQVQPDEDTDSDNDSSWDSDAEAMISNSEKFDKTKSDFELLESKSFKNALSNIETEVESKPVTTSQESKPVTTSQESKPVTTSQESKPVTTSQESKPVTTSQESKPVTTSQESKPVTTSQESKPVTTSQESKPVTTSQESKPVTTSQESKPVTTSQESKPVTTSQESKPVTTSQESKPVTTSQESKPVTTSQESKPVTTSQESKPVTTSQESKPVTTSQESKPVTTSQESKPVPISQESKPITVPQVSVTRNRYTGFQEGNSDDDENALNPEVTKQWVGVMSELTQRVGKSLIKVEGIPKMELDSAESNENVASWSSEESHSPSHSADKCKTINKLEHENIPAAATISSQTCRQTSSDIFGELQLPPEPLKPIDDDPNDGISVLHKRNETFSNTSSTANLLDNIDIATSDLSAPRNSSPFIVGNLKPTSLGVSALNYSSSSPPKTTLLNASAMVAVLIEKSKQEEKLAHKPLISTKSSSSLPSSSLLNDDVATLRSKLSKKTKLRSKSSKESRKLSCPETSVVAPSLLSKLKSQFARKKTPYSRSKSESLPDIHDKDVKDTEIEETERILRELLERAKEILLSTDIGQEEGTQAVEGNECNQDDALSTGSTESANARNRMRHEAKGVTYGSYQAPPMRLAGTPYCDSVIPNEPNPTVLKQVVRELSCIIDKTYGNYSTVLGKSGNLEVEIERLRKELRCCQTCKEELECEMMKLQADFQQTRFSLDENIHARESLEVMVAGLRAQMVRLEEVIDCESREKVKLETVLKEVEIKCRDGEGFKKDLEVQRNQLLIDCRKFEELHNSSSVNHNAKCSEFQEALARCCQQNEAYEEEINTTKREIANLSNEIASLKVQKEKFQYEIDRLIREFELERSEWDSQRVSLENRIAELARKLECCEQQKKDICEKMNLVVSEHHEAMDKLIEDAAKYKNMYDCLNDEFKLLAKKLEDCEEQKRKNFQNQQMQQMQSQNRYASSSPPLSSHNNYNAQSGHYSTDRNEDPQQLKNNLQSANNKINSLEKDLENSKVHCDDLVVANNQLQLDLQTAKESQKTVENELEEAKTQYNEKSVAYNQLESELTAAKTSEATLKKELETNKTHYDENANQHQSKLLEAKTSQNATEKEFEAFKTQHNEKTAQIQSKLQEAEASRKVAEKEFEAFKSQHNEKTVQLQSKLTEAEASHKATEKEFEAFKTLHNEKTAQLQTKLTDAEASCKAAEEELEMSQTGRKEKMETYNKLQSEVHATKKLQTIVERELEKSTSAYKKSQEEIAALQTELNSANLSLKKIAEGQELDFVNRNNDSDRVQALQQEYEVTMQKMNSEVTTLRQLFEKAQTEVGQANMAQQKAEDRCTTLLQSIKKLEGQLDSLHPKSTEAEFYKTEATRMQKELIERESKVAELIRSMNMAEEDFQKKERSMATVADKNKELTLKDYQICELREKIREIDIEKLRLQGVIVSLEERLQFVQPRLDSVFEERKLLEEKVLVLIEDNKKLSKAVEEDRTSRDLIQEELKEAQRVWENEVKAKGILAEKIAKYERINSQAETRNQNESLEVEKWKSQSRSMKTELKSERDLTTRLKYKFDLSREQCRRYKEQLEEMINDPMARKLEINMEEQKLKFEEHIAKLQHDREHLVNEIFRLSQSNTELQKEVRKLTEEIQLYEAEKTTLANIVKSKDRLEVELKNLKRAIKDQYVDRTELQRLKTSYDTQISEMKSQYELQVHSGINKKYSEVVQFLDQQTRNQSFMDQIRASSETQLRNELSTVKKSSDIELDNLKRQIREQEEQIKSERSSRRLITERFSTEKKRNDELIRKMQLLSTVRAESLNNNDIIEEEE